MENQVLAGVGNRLLAVIIDIVLFGLVFGALMMIFFGSAFSTGVSDGNAAIFGAGYIALNGFSVVAQIAYFAYFESSPSQATIGKRIMKIKVVDANGQRLQTNTAIIRSISRLISGMICLIGYFLAFFNKEEQTLHDMIAKTYVVKA
ncbi:Uncharacterized membrane protein YckC, RDD family [Pseudarcicella hirudinis]|uniref:Uncharacterized membrane protein YckC, RDD family n=1 Tax=Pseudarcicella hirudinis TaxID=1079859 RepID=A0A1I5SVX5_9BACT|nr:RDD family protein [Pseudarcicella hirudinis]SFP74376.1 Uncharacterized membrane protein YckC, RDD family [Pseudarcicella hirudinis]